MKPLLLIIFVSFFGTLLYSQNKKVKKQSIAAKPLKQIIPSAPTQIETQDWIKQKIEAFTHDYNKPELKEYGTEKYQVTFDDCRMVLEKKQDYMSQNPFNGQYEKEFIYQTYEIPLKELSTIYFVNDKVTQIVFKTKSNESLIKEIIKARVYDVDKVKFVNLSMLYISKDFFPDNLQERLTKAFDNLITYCGGTITKEAY